MSSVIGLLLGFGSVVIAILIEGGGDPRELLPFATNISAFVVIIGGTFGAMMLSVGMNDVKRLSLVFTTVFKQATYDFVSIIDVITSLAEKARREGLLSLENDIPSIENTMLAKGLQLVIDGTDPELVEAILQTNLQQKKNESTADATIFETLGGFAPTMGIIGTVMGLVGALGRMATAGQDATVSALGVAFIATFWGIGLANVLFLPVGNKVKARWRDELVLGQIIIEGITSIQAGNNPRIIKDRLLSFLPVDVANAAQAAEPQK